MALQKIMPPPWLAYPNIERFSIGWRMGAGEDYIDRFSIWLNSLSPEDQAEYRALFPEPVSWRGWWENDAPGQILEHEDFGGGTMAAGRTAQVYPTVASEGDRSREKIRLLPVLGASALRG